MEPIRQIVKVVNHRIEITLPENFNFDEVEITILPTKNKQYKMDVEKLNYVEEPIANYETNINQDFIIPEWQKQEVRRRTEAYNKNPSSAVIIEDVDDFF